MSSITSYGGHFVQESVMICICIQLGKTQNGQIDSSIEHRRKKLRRKKLRRKDRWEVLREQRDLGGEGGELLFRHTLGLRMRRRRPLRLRSMDPCRVGRTYEAVSLE